MVKATPLSSIGCWWSRAGSPSLSSGIVRLTQYPHRAVWLDERTSVADGEASPQRVELWLFKQRFVGRRPSACLRPRSERLSRMNLNIGLARGPVPAETVRHTDASRLRGKARGRRLLGAL